MKQTARFVEKSDGMTKNNSAGALAGKSGGEQLVPSCGTALAAVNAPMAATGSNVKRVKANRKCEAVPTK